MAKFRGGEVKKRGAGIGDRDLSGKSGKNREGRGGYSDKIE